MICPVCGYPASNCAWWAERQPEPLAEYVSVTDEHVANA